MPYGIVYYVGGTNPAHEIDAPYSTPDEARENVDLEYMVSEKWRGADIIEVVPCTSHDDIEWEPGAVVEVVKEPDD